MPDPLPAFTELAGSLDYPMLIVTASAGGEHAGCLVGFHTQCSIDPPRYLVGLSDKNHTFRVADRAAALAVHLIPSRARRLAELFGGETDDGAVDKFSRCAWHPGPEGLPILEDCPSWFAGRILDRHPLGDHVGFVLEPFAAASGDGGADFVTFQQVKDLDPGHEA